MMKGSFCLPTFTSSLQVTKPPVLPYSLPSPFLPHIPSFHTSPPTPSMPRQVPKPWLGAGPGLNSETLSSWISDLQVRSIDPGSATCR